MQQTLLLRHLVVLIGAFSTLSLISCGDQNVPIKKTDSAARLAGIWDLKSRILNGNDTPVDQRFMRLALNPDGTFRAEYRGEATQKWVNAGQGAFSYTPPLLTMHWESGATSTLLVRESEPDRMVLHHGRNLVPLAEQDPDEVFVRLNPEKGPTR
jgi:outer membrane lipoprotein-sorting protein